MTTAALAPSNAPAGLVEITDLTRLTERHTLGCVLGPLIVLMGCSGASNAQRPTVEAQAAKPPITASYNPLGDVLTQAHSAAQKLQDPSPDALAVVRFVIFTRGALPADPTTREALSASYFKLTSGALRSNSLPPLALSKLSESFTATHLERSGELPINLEVLEDSARAGGADLSASAGLTVVGYHGHALKGGLQLKVTCNTAAKLARSTTLRSAAQGAPVWIASLATFEVLSLEAFEARCADAEERWVRPSVELASTKAEGGQAAPSLRLITRGLNQWGRPELEHGPISEAEARVAFPRFINAMELVRAQPFPSDAESEPTPTPPPTYTLSSLNAELSVCLRPDHHYETSCRRISWRD